MLPHPLLICLRFKLYIIFLFIMHSMCMSLFKDLFKSSLWLVYLQWFSLKRYRTTMEFPLQCDPTFDISMESLPRVTLVMKTFCKGYETFFENSLLDLDLELFLFHFHFSISISSHFYFTFISRKECQGNKFHPLSKKKQ